MFIQKRVFTLTGMATLLVFVSLTFALPEKDGQQEESSQTTNVLWRDPGNIAARDLYWGAGSPSRAPVPPFTFLEEDKDGESPKFKVEDAKGVEWSVKLGIESQTEIVATRLVWAVGYFVEESYYFTRAPIKQLPRLSRGREFVEGGRVVRGARFEPRRKDIKRGDYWDWGKNPFLGTPELDGLKVLMILLNNYDARTQNNRVLVAKDSTGKAIENRYVVTDLGATLGKAAGMGGGRSKNDLEDFLSTRFVVGSEDGEVKFDYDTRPTKLGLLAVLNPIYYKGEMKKEKDMRGIPVAHARWIGALLSQLTTNQLRDAFRAADYDRTTAEGYVRALQQRINQLSRL
jgi:hypothetical protein